MSLEKNKSMVRRFYESAATGTLDDELIAEDFVYHGPPMLGEVRGREGFKQILGAFRGAFPNFETTIDDVIAEGTAWRCGIPTTSPSEGSLPASHRLADRRRYRVSRCCGYVTVRSPSSGTWTTFSVSCSNSARSLHPSNLESESSSQ
jgi:hypothetical protein